MKSISANLNIMIKAAEKASRALIRDFGEIEKLQVSIKGPTDFVSNADLKAEKIIIEELKKARPYYSIISEEDGSESNKDKNNTWIIDPIDGTTNFLHGIPHFAISIGLKSENEIKEHSEEQKNLQKDKSFYNDELKKLNTYMDPSGLTLEQIRNKLKSEDPSKFREVMADMNFIGEEPAWEKMELLERVSAPVEGKDATEAS